MGMGRGGGGGGGGVKEGDWSSHFVATGERPQNVCKNTALVRRPTHSLYVLWRHSIFFSSASPDAVVGCQPFHGAQCESVAVPATQRHWAPAMD